MPHLGLQEDPRVPVGNEGALRKSIDQRKPGHHEGEVTEYRAL